MLFLSTGILLVKMFMFSQPNMHNETAYEKASKLHKTVGKVYIHSEGWANIFKKLIITRKF